MTTRSHYLGGIARFYDSTSLEEVLPLAPVVFYDDFLPATAGAAIGTALAKGGPWITKNVQTGGTTVAFAGGSRANGTVIAALDATSEKQETSLYMGDVRMFSLGQGLVWEALVQVPVLPTVTSEIVAGMTAAWADGPDNIANSAYFWLSGAGGGLINCRVNDNSVPITASSGVTVTATGFHLLRIDCNDLTNIKFYIDGNQVATGTTFKFGGNAAAQLMQAFQSCYKTTGAGLASLEVDFVRVSQRRS